MAAEPGRPEFGCRYCRRRCWYGFGVLRDLSAKSKVLAERLKTASQAPDFVGNFDRLVEVVQDFAQEVTPLPGGEATPAPPGLLLPDQLRRPAQPYPDRFPASDRGDEVTGRFPCSQTLFGNKET